MGRLEWGLVNSKWRCSYIRSEGPFSLVLHPRNKMTWRTAMSQLPSHADATRRYPTFDQEGIAEIARVKPVSGTQYVPLMPETVVVMIDPRVLMRECLAKALEQSGGGLRALTFSTLEDWNKGSKGSDTPALVIVRAAGKMKQNDPSSEHGSLVRL